MNSRARQVVTLSGLSLLLAAVGCGRPFDIKTPTGMVELERQSSYDYRAMTPDGVVLGVRVADSGKADLNFWTSAIALHMKELSGYAPLAIGDVASADGVPGKELRFGHDEDGKPYLYTVRLFVEGKRLFVVEAGGMKEDVDRELALVEASMASIRVK